MSDAAETAERPKTLIQKLAEVMGEVERVAKRGRNDFHRYDYATEADITAAVREHMAARSLMLVPDVQDVSWRELPAKDGKTRDPICTLKVKFTVCDGENGNGLSFVVIGEGQDSGDKATYKAMTGATKYALLKLFLIPTGDDPERESEAPKDKRRYPGQRLGYDLPPAIAKRAEEREAAKDETAPPVNGTATLARLAEESAAKPETEEPPFQYEPENERKQLLKEIQLLADSIGLTDADRKQAWLTYVGKGVAQKNADVAALHELLGWIKARAGQ